MGQAVTYQFRDYPGGGARPREIRGLRVPETNFSCFAVLLQASSLGISWTEDLEKGFFLLVCLETGGLSSLTEPGLSLPVLGTFNLSCVFWRLMDSVSGSCWLNQKAVAHFLDIDAEPRVPGTCPLVLFIGCVLNPFRKAENHLALLFSRP